MSRPLIFNADDYGLSPAVSKGIIRAANGVVRSTTVMANLVTQTEIGWLKNSSLKAGVHLNLTLGRPVTGSFPRKLLDASGCFNKAAGLRKSTWASSKMQSAVAREWSAQIELLQSSGIKLTHLDSHHHTHLLEPLFAIALGLAGQHNLGLRTRQAQNVITREHSTPTPLRLEESFFGEQRITRDVILQLLAGSTGGSLEVMCHPGLVDAALLDKSGYRWERIRELGILGDPTLAGLLEQQGWNLCGYDEL